MMFEFFALFQVSIFVVQLVLMKLLVRSASFVSFHVHEIQRVT